MNGTDANRWIEFRLNDRRFALPMDVIERAVQASAITRLSDGPDAVLGAINLQGAVLPVFSLRRLFDWPDRPLALSDAFLVVRLGKRRMALLVDKVIGLVQADPAVYVKADMIVPGLERVRGVLALADGLVLICDLSAFLSLDAAWVAAENAIGVASGREPNTDRI